MHLRSRFFAIISTVFISLLGAATVEASVPGFADHQFVTETHTGRGLAILQLAQAKEKTEKAEKAEKAEKPDKDEKAEKAEKPEKTEKSEGPEAPAQSGQVSTGTPPDTADGGSVAAAADDQALDQQQALDAVAVGDALPLANIVEAFTDAGLGEVIDADLVTFNGTLFYQLRIINPEGVVRTVFYDAKSGQAIEAN